MATIPRIGAPLDLSDNSEFIELRRTAALGTLIELLELAAPNSAIGTEGMAALLGTLLDSG